MKLKLLLAVLVAQLSFSQTMLKEIKLSGDQGGRITGQDWSSTELVNKVHVLFYVDPDEKDMNEHVGQALKKEQFSRDNYQSLAVINMGATWKPNFILESVLEGKQKEYPDTIYVKDFNKALVKEWNLQDDSSNVLLFNKKGELIYKIEGKATDEQVTELIGLVKANL
ncbi:YtfJ family protein [Bacteriovorax sp. Seq25_V]|uniref:YtfJ family protein n=1 Tax=Bacteriovorax sp. Seq25_V TaxID=1201288 RepID=UPI00038A308E|nr:YtfJ family protein [Bacteriovorax sp. Seq25_V]EQC46018.1 hypothetical protein M900_1652 [Bacteriovorax sp. Seq25_V]